jgi:hypothetical protein
MRPLDEIYHLLDACHKDGLPYGVAKTGQTVSYQDEDDGWYQAGCSVHPRFTDNGDGTVRDNLTGLIWLKDLNCAEIGTAMGWDDALDAVRLLKNGSCGGNLSDDSELGAWRLPNVRELRSLIDHGQSGPALPSDHPFDGVPQSAEWPPEYFWSSTTQAEEVAYACKVDVKFGFVNVFGWKLTPYRVWPVRSSVLPMPHFTSSTS